MPDTQPTGKLLIANRGVVVGLASMIPAAGQRWGDFAAASILVSVPVVVLFVLFQKPLVQGLSFGGVKG